MKTSESGIAFIKLREGFQPKAYKDGNGYSIGYGTFIDTAAEQYLLKATITESEGDKLLRRDLVAFEKTVTASMTVSMNQSQFDALIDICYNIGETRFRTLSIVKYINEGRSEDVIRNTWKKTYVTSNGKFVKSLEDRRFLESNLFFSNSSSGGNYLLIFIIILIIFYYYGKSNSNL